MLFFSSEKVCGLEKQVAETKENSESIVAEYENAKIELESFMTISQME